MPKWSTLGQTTLDLLQHLRILLSLFLRTTLLNHWMHTHSTLLDIAIMFYKYSRIFTFSTAVRRMIISYITTSISYYNIFDYNIMWWLWNIIVFLFVFFPLLLLLDLKIFQISICSFIYILLLKKHIKSDFNKLSLGCNPQRESSEVESVGFDELSLNTSTITTI